VLLSASFDGSSCGKDEFSPSDVFDPGWQDVMHARQMRRSNDFLIIFLKFTQVLFFMISSICTKNDVDIVSNNDLNVNIICCFFTKNIHLCALRYEYLSF
jgi:hypothetical protein